LISPFSNVGVLDYAEYVLEPLVEAKEHQGT
jgi:hypothetical protein